MNDSLEPTDADLLRAYAAGDESACEVLYRRHRPVGTVKSRLHNALQQLREKLNGE